MPFNGSGVFTRVMNWVNDAQSNIKIRADRHDDEDDNFASGLTQCITKDGQTTVTANLPMAGFRHTGVGLALLASQYARADQVQSGSTNWAEAGGTVDAITATYSPTITALTDGMICYFRASGANTSTTPTFSPDGLTARNIVKTGGVALVAGDIAGAGYECILRYNLANTRWELLNPIFVVEIIPSNEVQVASATTTDIGAEESNLIEVTGTTTITSFGSSASTDRPLYFVRFSGALTLTHNGTSLIMPSGADIVTQDGDSIVALYLGSGNWRVVNYFQENTLFSGRSQISSSADWNTITTPGSYNTTGSSYTNAPLGGATHTGVLHVYSRSQSATSIFQTWWRNSITATEIWYRTTQNGTNWSTWERIFPAPMRGYGYAQNASLLTITANIPVDDTVPLVSEGTTLGVDVAYSAKTTTNKVRVTLNVPVWGMSGSGNTYATVALFAGSTCIGVTSVFRADGNDDLLPPVTMVVDHVPGVTTSVTYSAMAGENGSDSLYVNGMSGGTRLFGGASKVTLSVEELQV